MKTPVYCNRGAEGTPKHADYVSKKQNVVQSRLQRKQLTNGFAVFNTVAGNKDFIEQIPRPSAKKLVNP